MEKAIEPTETSYGIVPLRRRRGAWEVFLIQHRAGHWTLPKGHPEVGEMPLVTAKRELMEETRLRCGKVLSMEPLSETYRFRRNGHLIVKQASYFLAEIENEADGQPDGTEITGALWCPFEMAYEQVTFPETKAVLQRAHDQLQALRGDAS